MSGICEVFKPFPTVESLFNQKLDISPLPPPLGLDPSGYRHSAAAAEEGEREGGECSLSGLGMGGRASFEGEPLLIKCPHCGQRVEIKTPQVCRWGVVSV